MNLRSIQDMVDRSLVIRRQRGPVSDYVPNGYPHLPILDALYGRSESTVRMPGDVSFRRNAFELWAAKGYQKGFLPFASDRLAGVVGNGSLPDTAIMPHIFADEGYRTLAENKKEAYRKVRERAANALEALTVDFEGQTLTIGNY